MCLVTHELANAFRIAVGDFLRDGEKVIFFLTKPADGVRVNEPHAWLIAIVGSAAVKDTSEI